MIIFLARAKYELKCGKNCNMTGQLSSFSKLEFWLKSKDIVLLCDSQKVKEFWKCFNVYIMVSTRI